MTRRAPAADPFLALGLERQRELADDDVRAAWRRVAAATHPDRADGGNPAAFAAAAAAYTVLRTPAGRGEALADLLAPAVRPHWAPDRGRRLRHWLGAVAPGALLLAIRIRRGRPFVLALRLMSAGAACTVAAVAAGWQPATFGILTGAVTWLALTIRADLTPPPP